jgi:hypothetical protein
MSRRRVCRFEGRVGRTVVTLLVLSVVNVSVPAFAGQVASEGAPSASSKAAVTIPLPVMSLADQQSRQIRAAFERSVAMEARHLALADQDSSAAGNSGHWCAGGLALLVGGVAAAAVSGSRRSYDPQKPSPPVGVVLGTAAAAVGGISMIRACRH